MPLLLSTTRAASDDATFAAALLAAKAHVAASQERVRVAAAAWERERTAADALSRQVAEAERYFAVSTGQQPVVNLVDTATSSSHQAPLAGSGTQHSATDPLVAHLHLQVVGVQNIRAPGLRRPPPHIAVLRALAGPGPVRPPSLRPRRPRPSRRASCPGCGLATPRLRRHDLAHGDHLS